MSQGLVSSAFNSLWVWSSPSWLFHPPQSYCCFSSQCSWNPINRRQVWAMGLLFAFLALSASLSGHRLSVVASVAGRILALWWTTGMPGWELAWWQLRALNYASLLKTYRHCHPHHQRPIDHSGCHSQSFLLLPSSLSYYVSSCACIPRHPRCLGLTSK